MAFESPILTLEKLLLGGRKPAKKLTESERNLTAAAIVTKQEQAWTLSLVYLSTSV